MTLKQRIYNLLGITATNEIQLETGEKSVKPPTLPGGSAIPTDNNGIGYKTELLSDFPIQFLDLLDYLAINNEKVALAVTNTKLAHTPHEIYFADSVSEIQKRKMLAHLKNVSNSWFNGGIEILIGALLRQLVIKGCISADRVIQKGMKGISHIELINPKYIRFVRNGEERPYPVQIATGVTNGRELDVTGIKLRESYFYVPLEITDKSPYGIPMFLSALKVIDDTEKAKVSINSAVENTGLFGIYTAMMGLPPIGEGESEENYQARTQTYLDDSYKRIKRDGKSGVMVGFKDQDEFKYQANDADVSGGYEIMKMYNLLIYQGLKQDPNMMGESYTVSEAFAKVILAKTTQILKELQQRLASFLEHTYLMELILAGFAPQSIKVEFEESMPADKLITEQTRALKIANAKALFDNGIIDIETFANELGYDNAADSEKLQATKVVSSEKSFDYNVPLECAESNYMKGEKRYNDYSKSINDLYSGFIESLKLGLKSIKKETKANKISDIISKIFAVEFADKTNEIVQPYINESYNDFRKDKSTFSKAKAKFFIIPEAVNGALDFRVIEYLIGFENYYLGKFIDDPDTQKRINEFINNFYNDNANATTNDFINGISNLVGAEIWKIGRILATTHSKIRNNANVLYMQQAKVAKYEIIEVNDRLTCPHCRVLNGKTFEVSNAVSNIKKEIESKPEDVGLVSPFATQFPIFEFEKLDSKGISELGILKPPFHPNCRGVLAAII